MKNRFLLTIAILTVCAFGSNAVSAQITITIPKFKKPKIAVNSKEQSSQNSTSEEKTENNSKPEEPYVETDARISLFLNELDQANKQAAEYSPETSTYIVRNNVYDWLLRAVSPAERAEFFKKWESLMSAANRKRFTDGLDSLNATAAKKLPLYQADSKTFNFHNLAEEKLMKGTLENLASLKIYKIGLNQNNWLIDKNDLGIPTARYKHGMLWVRNAEKDYPYCQMYYVNIKQDYAGGGTYGASYARFIDSALAGCPANTK